MNSQPVVVNGTVLRGNTPYSELVSKIEEAFVAYHNGDVDMPEKSYVDVGEYNGDFRSMPAYVNADGWESSGVKWVNVHPDNTELPTVMGTFVHTDPTTGEPTALIDGTEMTKRRTAAVAALATKYLSRTDSTTLGILGAGDQSYEQTRAISTVRDIEKILVCDKSDDAVSSFKSTFDDEYNVSRVAPSELSQSDVVCTLTPSESPIVRSLDGVSHINAMGADAPSKQELDPSVIHNAEVFVDDWDQCIHSGEVSKLFESGDLSRSDVRGTLGEVASNQSDRSLQKKTTVFDSTGLAIQDVATASLVLENIDNEDLDTADLF